MDFWTAYRPYLGLFFGIFTGYLALAAFLPVLPPHLKSIGVTNDIMIAVAVTGTAVTAFVTRPFAGALADARGYKRIMIAGAAVVGLGSLFFLLPLSPALMIVVRMLQGFGEAMVFTAGAVWVMRLAPEDRRGRLVGLYGISMWLGITLGTVAGPILASMGGERLVWMFATIASFLGCIVVLRQREPNRPSVPMTLLVVPKSTIIPGTALAFAAAGYAGLAAFVVLHMGARGVEGGAMALNAFGIAYVAVRLIFGGLPDRLGPGRVVFWSGLGEAIGLLIIAFTPTLAGAVIGGLVMGAGFSLLYPALALLMIRHTPAERQGAALGAFTSFWDIGLGMFGLVTGWVAQTLGYQAVFLVVAAFALASGLVAFTEGWQRRLSKE